MIRLVMKIRALLAGVSMTCISAANMTHTAVIYKAAANPTTKPTKMGIAVTIKQSARELLQCLSVHHRRKRMRI